MAEVTGISWCDHTFNPWIGCTKVSAACDNCYAEAWGKRFGVEWGNHPRRRTSEANWKKPLKWNRRAKTDGIRRRVFCASLADVFDNQVPVFWLADLLVLIDQTRQLDWLLVTKRPQNILGRLSEARRELRSRGDVACMTVAEWIGAGVPTKAPANIWLGTTVENQEEADRRIPYLMSVPAAVRFLSCEPLLGSLDIRQYIGSAGQGIIWAICGGESGPGARPMNPQWARDLRDQCVSAGVAFHFKQWGEWITEDQYPGDFEKAGSRHADDLGDVALHSCEWPGTYALVGKKAAGRTLDGRLWDEFPA